MTGPDRGPEEAPPSWQALADRYWEELLEIEPLLGTEVGDERFDDRLPDPSEEGRARRERIHRDLIAGLESIDREDLDLIARTTLDLAEAIARRDLSALAHRIDRLQAVTHLWGPGTLLADLGSLQRADTPERRERYHARLAAVPAYLRAMGEVAEEGRQAGQTAPAVVVDRAIAQVERLLALDVREAPSFQPLGDASQEEREPFVDLLRDRVWPAYGEYLEVLRRYRPSARDSIGLSAMPGGDEMYRSEILAWTTLPLEAGAIHETGRRELEGIQAERSAIARRLGFRSPQEALEAYRASGGNRARSRQEMVALAEEQVRRGWDAAPGFFGRLPKANCEVRQVEEFREADMPFAFYFGPTEDGERPGTYYVNTSDLDERPLHHLASTTYHEANPGHHFQISIEQEMGDRPALRRYGGILAGSAFIEGWALYCERLAEEMDLYRDDYERLGMLDGQALRAARLVVDTGIHAFGWERERAIEQLIEAGAPQLDATIETDRYIAHPGQALAYKIGQIEIERWRREAESRGGDRFSLPDFHDRLLSLGSLPLGVLGRELDRPDGEGRISP